MTTTCEQLDDLLCDGSPASMETAARHAAECASCAETLAAWNDLSSTAASMKKSWDNDTLWPRIERSLRAERQQQPRGARARWIWQIAAAVMLAVGLAGSLVQILRVKARDAAFDRAILRMNALDAVEEAERSHLRAIDDLADLAESRLEDDNGAPLMIAYKEKLMLLDDAIAECQTNIDRNRQNAHLRRQLLALYTEKQQTLEDVLREEETHVSIP